MSNGDTNGTTIKINTAILIWLGGLTIFGAFYAGISIEKLNNLATARADDKRDLENKIELIRLKEDNNESSLKALTLSYTRGETSDLLKPRKDNK